jgi:DNA processing protein
MVDPVYEDAGHIRAARAGRPFEAAAKGLWTVGSLEGLARPCVAVVGTRAATPLGRLLARTFAARLARAGCCVISGLAQGIDACAHEGAIDGSAPTIGVLGSGHRRFFPKRNLGLADRIVAAGGAVLSPYPPEAVAQPWQFLARNGIVAALADAVVVIEAPARSGALNTAGWAAGRVPVLAVPGDVDRRHVQGCLALIRDGAGLARNADDVLEAIGLAIPSPAPARDGREAAPDNAVIAALRSGATTLDDIVAAVGLTPPSVLAELAVLELDGKVECRAGSTYALRHVG